MPELDGVKKASEYLEHAQECRELARGVMETDYHDQLLRMADVWEQLARDRIELTNRHPELRIDCEAPPRSS
jgi:hypothetical protein